MCYVLCKAAMQSMYFDWIMNVKSQMLAIQFSSYSHISRTGKDLSENLDAKFIYPDSRMYCTLCTEHSTFDVRYASFESGGRRVFISQMRVEGMACRSSAPFVLSTSLGVT